MLRAHEVHAPVLRRMSEQGSAATVAVLDEASPAQLELALVTGFLPEFQALAQPFWDRARDRRPGTTAHVDLIHHPAGSFHKGEPSLVWSYRREFESPGDDAVRVRELDEFLRQQQGSKRAIAVVSSWARLEGGAPAGQAAHPLDRPVLVQRGLDQMRDCIGICEVAGIFERALTGERLRDEA